jgi:uncharacterized membrane protein YgaE (UPF0421/DUF939 family)
VPTLTREGLRTAVQMGLVVVCAHEAGLVFTRLLHDPSARIGALWAVISGILVFQGTRQGTWTSAGVRIVATLVGVVVAALYVSLLSFGVAAMGASIVSRRS